MDNRREQHRDLIAVHRFLLSTLLLVSLMVGCGPAADHSAAPLPSPLPRVSAPASLEEAALVAERFLDAWQAGDYAAMHRLLTLRLREAVVLDDFRAQYEAASRAMGLQRLSYKADSLTAIDERVLVYQYAVTFQTRNLGSFMDEGRRLSLVNEDGQWRVAWSAADIFAEMGQGARLIFEPQVPSRANIYDRDGKALADQYGRMARVWVNNAGIPDRDACFRALATTLGKSFADMRDLFDVRSGPDWRVDAGLMEPATFIKNSDRVADACDADFEQRSTRRYVNGSLMPQALGHVGYPDAGQIPDLESAGFAADSIVGKAGIEASWNTTLSGKPGGRLSLISTTGARLRALTEVRSTVPQSLWLTIDSDLQAHAARIIEEAFRTSAWGKASYGASVVVMDVNSGEILALVSYPAYDGNALNPYPSIGRAGADKLLDQLARDERKPLLNRATQGLYPTGSVMKGLSAIAALEAGVFARNTHYFCSGSWTYGFDTRYDWLPGGHGSMTVSSGLTHSCNPFFYEVGFRLNAVDPWLLPSYARRFGLGELTGIGAVPEVAGSVPTPETVLQLTGLPWSYAFAVNLSIGQGEVQITPLQMARLYAALANGGYLLKPHLVRETGLLDQRTLVARREVMRDTGVSHDNLAIVNEGLCNVVGSYAGTAAHQFTYSPLLDIGVCGKTGTAQAPGEDDLPHSWFVAYAPAKEPQVVALTMVENAGEGSAVAAPLTRQILEFYFFDAF